MDVIFRKIWKHELIFVYLNKNMKICSKCKISKEKTEFYKDSRKPDGLKSWCKLCHLEDSKKREKKYNETRKKWRENNKEESRIKKRDYYNKKKDDILLSNKSWRQTFKGRLLSYIRGAKQRNIEWKLTDDQFKSFWDKSCYYCGEQIKGVGIDRLNSDKDYVIDNCVSCCFKCNKIKMELSYNEFLERVIKIYKNLNLWDHIKK